MVPSSPDREPFIVNLYHNAAKLLEEKSISVKEIDDTHPFQIDSLSSDSKIWLEPNQIHTTQVKRVRYLLVRGRRLDPPDNKKGIYGLEFGGLLLARDKVKLPSVNEMMRIVSRRNHQRGYSLTLSVEGDRGLVLYGPGSEEVNRRASALSPRDLVGDEGMAMYMDAISNVYNNLDSLNA